MMKKLVAVAVIVFISGYEAYKAFEKATPLQEISTTSVGDRLGQKRIRLMTYNVENLFDTLDDPEKDDETFLPLSKKNESVQLKCKKSAKTYWAKECLETNWTPFKLEQKMKRLAEVIKASKPDVLILQEIENIGVLNLFNSRYLGYPTAILHEGPDKRGIDVAILSKLPEFSASKIHLQKHSNRRAYRGSRVKATRGILEANLRLPNGESLRVFGVHFPSQGSPTKSRKESVEMLNRLGKASQGLYIAGGDFNIINSESFLYQNELKKIWRISHLEGCKKCKGTNYYHRKRSWSFLDALLFSKNFEKTWKLDRSSIDVYNKHTVQNNRFGNPAKFEMGKNPTGVSDHWPVVAEIYL